MAILTIECESATPGRVLIRVKSVADTITPTRMVERAFSDLPAALAYLGALFEEWVHTRTVIDVETGAGDAGRDD
jgi:hypothetical protein